MKIGIIGLGMVGGTVYHALKFFHEDVKSYDKYNPSDAFEEVLESDIVFVAVPTNEKDGRLDCSIVYDVLINLEKNNYSGIVCIKSTLGIFSLDAIRKLNLRIVYVPEFLHEKIRLSDFLSPDHVVMSGSLEDIEVIKKALPWIEGNKYFIVDDRTAELTKLVINAFAATKISFSNEVNNIANEIGADAKKVMEILRNNKRCAPEYTDPTKGPYAGACLPKDTRELINFSDTSILLKAVETLNESLKKK